MKILSMYKILFPLLLIISDLTGQQYAIKFIPGKFEAIKQRAAEEDKLIFMDVYTTWCGPCKRMDNEVFNVPEIGDYFNEHFISYKVDAEHGEGIAISRIYKIGAYPSLLFLNSEGEVVYTIRGFRPYEPFLDEVKSIIDPSHEPTLAQRYAEDKAYRKELEAKRKEDLQFIRTRLKNPKLDALHKEVESGNAEPAVIADYLLERKILGVWDSTLWSQYWQEEYFEESSSSSDIYVLESLQLTSIENQTFDQYISYMDTCQSMTPRNENILLGQLRKIVDTEMQFAMANGLKDRAPEVFSASRRILDLQDLPEKEKNEKLITTKFDFYRGVNDVELYYSLHDSIWNVLGEHTIGSDSTSAQEWVLWNTDIILGFEELNPPVSQWQELSNRAEKLVEIYRHPNTFAALMLCQHRLNKSNEAMHTMRNGMIYGKKNDVDTEVLFKLFSRIKKSPQ